MQTNEKNYKIPNSKTVKSLHYNILGIKQYTPSFKTCYMYSIHVIKAYLLLNLVNIFI